MRHSSSPPELEEHVFVGATGGQAGWVTTAYLTPGVPTFVREGGFCGRVFPFLEMGGHE